MKPFILIITTLFISTMITAQIRVCTSKDHLINQSSYDQEVLTLLKENKGDYIAVKKILEKAYEGQMENYYFMDAFQSNMKLAYLEHREKNLNAAIQWLNSANDDIYDSGESDDKIELFMKKREVHRDAGEHEEELECYESIQTIYDEYDFEYLGIIDVMIVRAEIYAMLGKYNSHSAKILNTALELAQKRQRQKENYRDHYISELNVLREGAKIHALEAKKSKQDRLFETAFKNIDRAIILSIEYKEYKSHIDALCVKSELITEFSLNDRGNVQEILQEALLMAKKHQDAKYEEKVLALLNKN